MTDRLDRIERHLSEVLAGPRRLMRSLGKHTTGTDAMTIPNEVAAVLAEMAGAESFYPIAGAWKRRLESALASSAEPTTDDAKDAARFRWLRDHAINTEGRKGTPWCVYGLDLGDCTPTFGAELVAMVDDAMANGIACSPVPVESLGRDAEPLERDAPTWWMQEAVTALDAAGHGLLAAAMATLAEGVRTGRVVSAPPPASVPDGWRDHGNSALAHISNALDDLDSSPDQRPVPLLNEAMFHIREMLSPTNQEGAAP